MGRHAEGRTGELTAFRRGLHQCLTRWGDALFELCDAVLCGVGPVSSIPSLSLEPEFSRSHGSLYKALSKGRINEDRLRRLLVANRPVDWPAVFAVDASTWARCDAECSPGRGYYFSASKHSAGQPIVAPVDVRHRRCDSAPVPLAVRASLAWVTEALAEVGDRSSRRGRLEGGD
jgi:hypothetical protein